MIIPRTLDQMRAHVLLSWLTIFIFNIILLFAISFLLNEFELAHVEPYMATQLRDLTFVFAPSMLILVGLWFVPTPAAVQISDGQRIVMLALSWFYLAAVSMITIYSALYLLNSCEVDPRDNVERCKNAYSSLSEWQPVIFGPLLYVFGAAIGSGAAVKNTSRTQSELNENQ